MTRISKAQIAATPESHAGLIQEASEAAVKRMVAEATEAKRPRKTRQPVKAINKTPETVAANAKADAERKKASKAALKKATAPKVEPKPEPVQERDHGTENLEAARMEAEATGMTFEEACSSMGVDPVSGQPVKSDNRKYVGPMLALRDAVKRYTKAANGQPCNGDELAQLCGQYSRETVVRGLIDAMGLGHNPYLHLNPGQQSMNLRNKARAQVKAGKLEIREVAISLNLAGIAATAATAAA